MNEIPDLRISNLGDFYHRATSLARSSHFLRCRRRRLLLLLLLLFLRAHRFSYIVAGRVMVFHSSEPYRMRHITDDDELYIYEGESN